MTENTLSKEETSIIAEIETLMKVRLCEAYAVGHEHGYKMGLVDAVKTQSFTKEHLDNIAYAASETERIALRGFLTVESTRYHHASEAAKLAKRALTFLDSRGTQDAP